MNPVDDISVAPGIYKVTGVLNPPLIDVNPSAIGVAVDITIVPEPCSMVLFVGGLLIVKYFNGKRGRLKNSESPTKGVCFISTQIAPSKKSIIN